MYAIKFRCIKYVRPLFQVVVRLPSDPTTYAWQGGAAIAKDPCLRDISLSKLEYMEKGHQASTDKYYL